MMNEFLISAGSGFIIIIAGIALLSNFFFPLFLKYNDKMNDLYMGELKDMVPDSPIKNDNDARLDIEMTNQIILSTEQLSRLSINDENTIII